MIVKRLVSFGLAMVMLFSLTACNQGQTSTETTTTVATKSMVDLSGTTQTAATDENGKTLSTTPDGKTTTTRSSKNLVSMSTATAGGSNGSSTIQPITIKEGTVPLEKGKNFGGETFTYAYYGGAWTVRHSAWFKEFETKYNCKMDVRAIPDAEYAQSVASAMAGGKSYDLVFLHGFDYPSQIVANTMMPLNDYITTADVWKEGSDKTGGFSYSLMEATSLNGNIYCVAGTYLNAPGAIFYNKKLFKEAGYDGAEDPMALYKAGKWTWEKLYEMLSDIQEPAKNLYGLNTISPFYDHLFINSYGTDLGKLTNDGRIVSNMTDKKLYEAFTMLQKYSYGEHRVTNPDDMYEDGMKPFLSGKTAAFMHNSGKYLDIVEEMDKKLYSMFGTTKAQAKANLGCVPMPISNSEGNHPIWHTIGYGVGNGTDAKGRDFALCFAKYDSTVNQEMTWVPEMPSDVKNVFCGIMDADNLIIPMGGFSSSAGSLGKTEMAISSKIAVNGDDVQRTLKSYEKLVGTIIKQALAG